MGICTQTESYDSVDGIFVSWFYRLFLRWSGEAFRGIKDDIQSWFCS